MRLGFYLQIYQWKGLIMQVRQQSVERPHLATEVQLQYLLSDTRHYLSTPLGTLARPTRETQNNNRIISLI